MNQFHVPDPSIAVCVFCGSSTGSRAVYAETAARLGETIARRGWRLVYGGGHVGLMGVVADAALRAGGQAIGVIPEALLTKELAHLGLTELHVVGTMHERKALMAQLSDGFVALPGGFGTLDELCEAITWAQLGIHRKPCALLDVDSYFAPLLALFDHAVSEGFVRPEHRNLVLHHTDPDALLDALRDYVPPSSTRWVTEREM
jgi:uncharacterized protein (TIGR00730 family)